MRWPSARNLIDRKVKQLDEQVKRGEKLDGTYLTYLLSSNKLSLAEIYITLTELLLGGIDTVSMCVCVCVGVHTLSLLSTQIKIFCRDRDMTYTDKYTQYLGHQCVQKDI